MFLPEPRRIKDVNPNRKLVKGIDDNISDTIFIIKLNKNRYWYQLVIVDPLPKRRQALEKIQPLAQRLATIILNKRDLDLYNLRRVQTNGVYVRDNEQTTDEGALAAVDRVVRSLEEQIVLGRLRPRERLLEEELAKHFDAKRHVIRAALAELEAIGIIVRQPNRGAAVKDFTPQEVEQIYDIRQLLEGHAAAIMPLPASAEVVEQLKAAYAKHSDAVDARQLHLIFRSNLEFHRILFGACGNPFLAKQIDQLASRVHAIRFISDDRMVERAKDARQDHAKMIEYVQNGDRQSLVDIVARHIQPSKDAYLRLASVHWSEH
ncbi:GntR family transcriptional regulator [Sinorhizobium meliloti]|uniref:GntR family transcriptional regulator n=1 Tax=Rhizobium meliloti TaxID=382 RepID=UPI0018E1EAB1|nr:GntR family transcriptional regulator [Sinorhizobium meliloti]